jgi:hypothetical protein
MSRRSAVALAVWPGAPLAAVGALSACTSPKYRNEIFAAINLLRLTIAVDDNRSLTITACDNPRNELKCLYRRQVVVGVNRYG